MKKSLKNYLTLIFLGIVWGSSFILMKKGLVAFDYMQVAALRLFIAFIALIPFIKKAIREVKKEHYFPLLIMAFFGNGLPAFLFAKAQTELDSSVIGILNSLVPLFTLLLALFFFKSKSTKTNVLGIIIGLFGAIILIYSTINDNLKINNYIFFVIIATLMYAASINVIKKYLYNLDALSAAALSFLIIGPLSAIYIFNSTFDQIVFKNDVIEALMYIVILAIVCTALAVVVFNRLITNTNAIFASSVTYLIPITAIFWGFYDGENIMGIHFVSIIIILSGVYLVNKKSN